MPPVEQQVPEQANGQAEPRVLPETIPPGRPPSWIPGPSLEQGKHFSQCLYVPFPHLAPDPNREPSSRAPSRAAWPWPTHHSGREKGRELPGPDPDPDLDPVLATSFQVSL